jgi:hypothetical protein
LRTLILLVEGTRTECRTTLLVAALIFPTDEETQFQSRGVASYSYDRMMIHSEVVSYKAL